MAICDSCHDAHREANRAIEQARSDAKKRSNEEKQPIAICKEQNEYFITGAYEAISKHFAIVEVISEL